MWQIFHVFVKSSTESVAKVPHTIGNSLHAREDTLGGVVHGLGGTGRLRGWLPTPDHPRTSPGASQSPQRQFARYHEKSRYLVEVRLHEMR